MVCYLTNPEVKSSFASVAAAAAAAVGAAVARSVAATTVVQPVVVHWKENLKNQPPRINNACLRHVHRQNEDPLDLIEHVR